MHRSSVCVGGKTPVPGLPDITPQTPNAIPPVFTVNDIAGFFKATDNAGHQLLEGPHGYTGNTLRAQLAILLHETAHQITVTDFQHDSGLPKVSAANDLLVNAHCHELIEGPSSKKLTPSSGAVGTSVTISGQGFGAPQGSSTIIFNGVAATPSTGTDNQIIVNVPATATTGDITVTVGGPGGQSASKRFTVE